MKTLKRIVLWGLVVVVVLLVSVRIALPSVGVKVVNGVMADLLTVEGTLGDIDLGLFSGRVRIENLEIAQDPAFRPDLPAGTELPPMIRLDSLSADVSVASLATDQIVIEEVSLKGLELNIVRDTNGVMNIASMVSRYCDPHP